MANEDARKLFVAGLPDSVTEDVLKQLFEATGGTVSEISLPKDRATGRPRGFGFVTLSTSDEAQAARDSLDGSIQAGKSISVRPFQAEPPKRDSMGAGPSRAPGAGPGGGPPGAPDRTLYVGNLPYDVTQQEIETLISGTNAGPVARVHLPTDPEGRKRGFGFVTMGTADGAKGAIEALRGADLRGRRLVVNLAHPKGERPPRDFAGGGGGGGGYSGGGGGPSGFPGGGGGGFAGGGGGFPPSGGPPPERRTFDQRRRGSGGGGGPEGEGAGRRKKNWDKERGGGGSGRGGWDEE
jgi:RNA recognition motif-containing protein